MSYAFHCAIQVSYYGTYWICTDCVHFIKYRFITHITMCLLLVTSAVNISNVNIENRLRNEKPPCSYSMIGPSWYMSISMDTWLHDTSWPGTVSRPTRHSTRGIDHYTSTIQTSVVLHHVSDAQWNTNPNQPEPHLGSLWVTTSYLFKRL